MEKEFFENALKHKRYQNTLAAKLEEQKDGSSSPFSPSKTPKIIKSYDE